MTWQLSDIPELQGKVAIVTGGNTGLGFESSFQLAKKGASIVIACRSQEKGIQACQRIERQLPQAKVQHIPLDLCDLGSITAFVDTFKQHFDKLDILLNNAGVVNLETLTRTQDGHEMHMATNHYGHFSLTLQLLPLIISTDHARVVTVSSAGYKVGEIRFDDINWQQRQYHRIKSYGDSKLANLLFTEKLQRVFDNLECSAISVSAHPGLTATERQQSIGIGGFLAHYLASDVSNGVRPQLRAATGHGVQGGDFYGPRFGLTGAPKSNRKVIANLDKNLADQLWTFTSEVCGVNSLV